MSNNDPRDIGALVAKHGFNGVESTRHMTGGSLDPAALRTRMAQRSERADDLTYDDGDVVALVAAIIDRVKKQHKAMEDASLLLDAEIADQL